jgi:uncharacterized protein
MDIYPEQREVDDAVTEIAIMAKAPVAGLCKTRLIPRLGADGAAALQSWLLGKVVRTAVQAGLGPVTLWCTPDTRHPRFLACRDQYGVSLKQQPETDLGHRMLTAIRQSSCTDGCLVIGTDCPVLESDFLRNAASVLKSRQVVVAPAEDGGYVLIGLRESREVDSVLFEGIEWSTERVMSQTRQRLDARTSSWTELQTLWDVDCEKDLFRLMQLHPEVETIFLEEPS